MMNDLIHVDGTYLSLFKHDEELCGDKVVILKNEKFYIMVLADGLGSGVKANILSTLTSTIISQMIYEGFSLDEAVYTISDTLPICKERQVAYSTFTILQVFYNGEAYLAEFDNPGTLIIRDNKILDIKRNDIFINNRKIKTAQFFVKENDFIISFSDGIIHAGVGRVLNFGWDIKEVGDFLKTHIRAEDKSKDVNKILLANVNHLYGGIAGDDSTICTSKIIKARETIVMVGPPSKKEDDEKVVKKLMTASGLKICCGGTTSNIVARVINKELKVDDIINENFDVPPKGYIEGVDLVTEGVLTLQKTNRYLRKGVNSQAFLESLENSKENDGASSLIRALLNDSSYITFMVGLADNPAHDSIAYSTISLNAKIDLINEMANNLRKLNKIVNIEMF